MTTRPLRVAVVCTGNICRSPMAEVALLHLIAEDDQLRGVVNITSAGTAKWHVGSPMDPRARAALDRAGLFLPGTPAAFADRAYLNAHDFVVVMTREHRHDVDERLTNETTEIVLLRNLIDPGLDLDVADPYYGADIDFDDCLDLLRRGGQRLTSELRRRLDASGYGV
jgi:protein-tyrosine phosphatase